LGALSSCHKKKKQKNKKKGFKVRVVPALEGGQNKTKQKPKDPEKQTNKKQKQTQNTRHHQIIHEVQFVDPRSM